MSTHPGDDLLVGAVDGTLSTRDRDLLEAHLATCGRCRGEVELAVAARADLGALPGELTPPIDVAAAVAATLAAAGRSTGASPAVAAAPRWYRAAGLVAAAAAIGLAVLVLPDLTGDDEARDTTAAVGVGPQEAGLSAAGEDIGLAGSGAPAVEVVSADFDHASLVTLVEETRRATPSPSAADATSVPTVAAPPGGDDALACLRAGTGDEIAADARVVRLLATTFEGTPAYVGVVLTDPADGPVDIQVIAVATDGCRLLDSA